MRFLGHLWLSVFVFACSGLGHVTLELSADIVDIGPFVGTHSDDYNSQPGGSHQQLDVFGGLATIRNLTDGGAIKIELSSQFNGDLVVPRSNPRFMGQLGILEWQFNSPVSQFGSWFENNSGTDDAVIEFFDIHGALIGTRDVLVSTSAQEWQWNGWESDTPISRMIVTGNSQQYLNGFIWYEDSQATVAVVPEPTIGIAMFVLGGMTLFKRRRTDC